jgi:glycosyltransferase involved in cell wall biosynthesis
VLGATSAGLPDLSDLAAEAGLRRIHVLAWRDLVDIEAGGSEVHAAKILSLWAEAGLEVTMRTSYAQGHPFEGDRDGYHLVRRHGRFMAFPTAVVSELAGSHGPRDGLVEIWNGVPFLTPLWATGPRIAWLHHVHRDMWEMVLEPRLAKAGKYFERRLAPPLYRSTPVVTLSESSRRELVDYLGLRPAQISVVPPGIDERFTPGEERSDVPLVVAAGRLMPSKRFDVLVRVAHAVRRDVPDLQLVIVGDGYERPELEAQVAALGADDWVRIAGRVSDEELLSLYRRAWVVASASIAEGWGMTLTEAAACGTPAVATDIAGHRDSVAAGLSGLLSPDDRALARDLTAVLTDAELRAKLSDGALRHAATLTWPAAAVGAFAPLALDAIRRQRRRRRR